LDTWTDGKGGLHGYVIHHHRDYCVLISPTTWAQSVRILAHLDAWRKTRSSHWLEKARRGAIYLASSYVPQVHLFHDATTPLTLINLAWPTLALLRTAKALREAGDPGWEKLAEVPQDCIHKRIIPMHWDASVGDFFFCPPGFPAKRVHTYNQSAIAISALCAHAELYGDEELVDKYARPSAEHLLVDQVTDRRSVLYGGWGYNDGGSSHLFYYLYTALNLRGLLDLYEHTNDSRYLHSARMAGDHLIAMVDEDSGLFAHRYVRRGRKVTRFTYPIMVSASGLGLLQLRRLARLLKDDSYSLDPDRLTSLQQPNGGFPSFIGSTDIWTPELFPCEPTEVKWRDVVCVPFWAVFTLELLADLLQRGEDIPPPMVETSLSTKTDDGYEVVENESTVYLKKGGLTVSYFLKKEDYMLFSTEPMRGVPFGAFANSAVSSLAKIKRRFKRAMMIAALAVLVEAIIIALMLM